MTKTCTITVDGKRVRAEPGETLLPAIRRAGARVPSLCHADFLEPYGACRVCMVEVSRPGRKAEPWLVTSCNFPVEPGLVVKTKSAAVKAQRQSVLELLLSRCPDAPEIKKLAAEHGVRRSTLPVTSRDEKCILCGLCVRMCSEVVGANAIAFSGRGTIRKVGLPFERDDGACTACGACAWICPTDAIDMERPRIETLKKRWGEERPCRYALLGIAPGTVCPRSYACGGCEVEQRMILMAYPNHPAMLRRHVVGAPRAAPPKRSR